jgi:hypothetical protein
MNVPLDWLTAPEIPIVSTLMVATRANVMKVLREMVVLIAMVSTFGALFCRKHIRSGQFFLTS